MEAACGGSIPFSSSIVTILCDGSSDDCELGDTAVFTGSVTASEAFENDDVFVKSCLAGVCPEMAQKVSFYRPRLFIKLYFHSPS